MSVFVCYHRKGREEKEYFLPSPLSPFARQNQHTKFYIAIERGIPDRREDMPRKSIAI